MGELREAVMRAWPAVIAVIGEVHPRDATMQEELLRLGVDAFDARYAGADMVELLLKPVLKEMQMRSAKYLVNGGKEPTWKEVVEVSSEEAMKVFALRSTLAAKAALEVLDKPPYVHSGKPPPQQASAKQQQQTAAEVKKLRRLAAVAKQELRDTPWVSPEDLAKLPPAEQTERTAVWKARKEVVEAGDNLE